MKTNKLWSMMMMLVLVLGMTLSFSSCGGDDDDTFSYDNHSELVGTWLCNNGNWNYDVTFKSDGTFTFNKKAKLGSTGGATGVYKVSGDSVTLIGAMWTLYSDGDYRVDDNYSLPLSFSNGKLSFKDGVSFTKQ